MAAFVSRYANAFADVVTAAKLDTAAIDAQLADFLATWDGSPELRDFFENPAVPALQKVEILDKLNAKLKMQKELRNLIAVLISNDRIAHVGEVAQAYRRLLQQQLGIARGDRDRARTRQQGTRIAGGRDRQTCRLKIDASFTLDKTILGGTVVRIGSTVYDGSVRGRLERLKEALIAG